MGVLNWRRSPQEEAARRQKTEDLKARRNIIDVSLSLGAEKPERAGVKAKKVRCLIHSEKTASLHLYPGAGNFHCFGCGANGDVIDLVMAVRRCTFLDALNWLGGDLPDFDPAERAKIVEIETAERRESIANARSFFAHAETVTASDPGGRYLLARGIRLPVPPTVRFGMVPSWQDPETKEWGRKRPALILGCQDEFDVFQAIQRIFVDGPHPDKAAAKLSLGALKGAALRLGSAQENVITTEGPEDGLSIWQDLTDKSVWVPCGTGLWPFMRFPSLVSSITLAGQNDKPGRAAVDKAEAAFLEEGFGTARVWPREPFKDWNDMTRGKAA